MPEVIFESQLLKDGHLYCPKKYATSKARFRVIVSFPDEIATDSEIETASIVDISDDFLTRQELDYYLNLSAPGTRLTVFRSLKNRLAGRTRN